MRAPYQVVSADIGGTHARFAIAEIEDGAVRSLNHMIKLRAADHPSLHSAWEQYRREYGRALPKDGAIAVAAPVRGDAIRFTNLDWTLNPAQASEELQLDRLTVVNDFGAVCHAVETMGRKDLALVCGPDTGLPREGAISVIGPGTGLGVAYITRTKNGSSVFATEGSHIDFAPLDEVEDRILHRLRKVYARVSLERVVSGAGLRVICDVLCEIDGADPKELDDLGLWALALSGRDPIATAALDRFCLCLGSAAGDFVLAHGSQAIVIAGGLGQRLGERLTNAAFRERMVFKGRFTGLLESVPAYRALPVEPGLTGAAVAFAKEHLE